jgi:hypothetical protein
MANSTYTLSYMDAARKLSSVSFILPSITAANHDTTVNTALDALMDAVNALSWGNLITRTLTHSVVKVASTPPAEENATKHTVVQMFYEYLDGNTDLTPGYISVPVAEYDTFDFPSGQSSIERADFNAAVEALASAMETYCQSPDGTAITVTRAVKAGRS